MKSIFLLSLLAVTTISYSQKVDKALEKRLAAHVKVLAADDMQGRATGSDGERKAANYIVEHFRKSKLKPLGDSLWYQVFTVIPHAAGQV
ncbi:MAG: hypothetical protein ACKO7B_00740, partial [Flavobacteriales bacterium]